MWKSIEANSNLIQTKTDKAVLIKLPKSDLRFWHSSKCVRTGGKSGYRLSISYTDSFEFKCFRKGGTGGKEILEEKIYKGDEIKKAFGLDVDVCDESQD
jgi:hypothetical protein